MGVIADDRYFGKDLQRSVLGSGYVVYNGGFVVHGPSAQITIPTVRFNGNVTVYGNVEIHGNARIVGNVSITGDITHRGDLQRNGNSTMLGDLTTSGGTVRLN